MGVYGYIRVSTKSQSDDGLSIEAQQRQIEGYAMMKGLGITALYIERAVSGSKPISIRPEGKRLRSSLRSGDSVICAKLDRMFRNAKDALTVSEELRQNNIKLHLLDLGGDVTGNGVSKMFFTIVAAFAEFERDRTAERICDVKESERNKGRYLGGSKPFGYNITCDGYLSENLDEQEIICQILEHHKLGVSYRKISYLLRARGIPISHTTVKKVVLSSNF